MDWLQVPKNRKRGVHGSRRGAQQNTLRELIWPSMGWRAFALYILLQLRRSAEDPHKVALGAAIGMWMNFVPLPGLGALISIGLAYVFRANLAAAFIGQLPGNPMTFPLFWSVMYQVGKVFWPSQPDTVGLHTLSEHFSWAFLWDNGVALMHTVIGPLVLGGQVLGVPLAVGTYFLVHWEVKRFWAYRRARQKAMAAQR